MGLACREYVSCYGIVTPEASIVSLHALKELLDALRQQHPSLRFRAKLFRKREELEQELLDPQTVLARAGGPLPIIWLNLTYDPNELDYQLFSALEAKCQLVLLGEFHDERAL